MGRGKDKAPHQAATRGGGFTGLPHTVQDSEAFRHLADRSVRVLLSVLRRFNGRNNGAIFVSYDEICHDLNMKNRGAVGRAFAELITHGFVEAVTPENRLHHKAREYRLTWINTTAGGRHVQATEEYRQWTPTAAKNHGEAASPRGAVHGEAVSPTGRVFGEAALLRVREKRAKSVEPAPVHGEAVSRHVLCHVGAAKQGQPTPLPVMATPPTIRLGSLHQCQRCGGPITFDKPARGQPKRYCTEKCRKADERRRAYQRARNGAALQLAEAC